MNPQTPFIAIKAYSFLKYNLIKCSPDIVTAQIVEDDLRGRSIILQLTARFMESEAVRQDEKDVLQQYLKEGAISHQKLVRHLIVLYLKENQLKFPNSSEIMICLIARMVEDGQVRNYYEMIKYITQSKTQFPEFDLLIELLQD